MNTQFDTYLAAVRAGSPPRRVLLPILHYINIVLMTLFIIGVPIAYFLLMR